MTTAIVTRDAGRELDALVAEYVMGWLPTLVGVREQLRFHPPSSAESPTGWVPVDVGPGEEWSPSTDIRAAWDVVTKMTSLPRGEEWTFYLDHDRSNPPSPWEAVFGEGDFEISAPTAPLAICLAALKAVGA